MKNEVAKKILQETETGYDSISEKFSQTRKHFWRGLEFIKDFVKQDANVLDFGCGNGRLLELIGERKPSYYGTDVSQLLIDLAKEKYQGGNIHFSKIHPVKSGEVRLLEAEFDGVNPIQTTLPFTDKFFNTVYSIAVFHHFPSKKYRQEMANELYRVANDGGVIVITVWYLWQKKYLRNIIKNWIAKIKGKSCLDWNDCEISFTDNAGKKFFRFHHAFTKREIRKLFSEAGFNIERCDIPDGRNILLIGRK